MQYRKGLVTVGNGSAVVTGNSDTKWIGKFTEGCIFAIPNQVGTYYVQSVDTDSQLTLSTPWGGDDLTATQYWVTVDFTPILGLPLAQPNDLDATRVIEKALLQIDSLVAPSMFGIWSVKSATTTGAPASPADGDAYIVPKTGATGIWSPYPSRIAVYRRGAWLFFVPSNGQLLKAADSGSSYNYTASSNTWVVNTALSSGQTLVARENAPTAGAVMWWDSANSIASTVGSLTLTNLVNQLADRVTLAAQTLTASQKTQVQTNLGLLIGTNVQAFAARLGLIVSQGIDASMFHTAFLDTDITLAANSATRIASQSATKAYVDAKVAALIASSPSTLDTLKELADALGDDPNFATTMTTALGSRLRVDAVQSLTGTQQAQGRSNLGFTLDTDGLLAANSDANIPSQKAIRTYVAAQVAAAGVADHAISYVKVQNVAASRLLGNPTGAVATLSEITLGAGLAFSGTALQTAAHTGDVTSAVNSLVMAVAKIQGTAVTGTTGANKVVFDTAPTISAPILSGVSKIDCFSEGCSAAQNALTATTPLDLAAKAVFDVTLKANTAITFTNCPGDSNYLHTFLVYVRQDSTGSRTFSWPASVRWSNGSPPAGATAAGHYDVYQFMTKDGGTTFEGGLILGNLAAA